MARVFEKIRCQSEYVMRVLGTGHRENVYHRALITALNKAGIQHRSEVACPIWFMGECVGFGRADLVIDDVIIEIKANKSAPHKTSPQLEKYIVSLSQSERRCFQGMVVNFNQNSGVVNVYTGEAKLFERSVKRKIESAPPIFMRKAKAFEELSKFRYQAGPRK